MEYNTKVAIERYQSGEQPSCSFSIDEIHFTYGYGQLDDFGHWEFEILHAYLTRGEMKKWEPQKRPE